MMAQGREQLQGELGRAVCDLQVADAYSICYIKIKENKAISISK